jgi:hypothetical protein
MAVVKHLGYRVAVVVVVAGTVESIAVVVVVVVVAYIAAVVGEVGLRMAIDSSSRIAVCWPVLVVWAVAVVGLMVHRPEWSCSPKSCLHKDSLYKQYRGIIGIV